MTIYLDHAATAPINEAAIDALNIAIENLAMLQAFIIKVVQFVKMSKMLVINYLNLLVPIPPK